MPFIKRSGAPSEIDNELKSKRQQIIEEERIRVLRESFMLFYDKLMEKYELVYLPDEARDENNVDETKGGTQVNELDSKEAKSVNRKEVEDFANEYADTKPIGF